jgi:hypothetical protein
MPDRLNLSLWLRGFGEDNMLRRFEELLHLFPFSRLKPGVSSVRVYALEFQEPPLFEEAFTAETGPDVAVELAREFHNPDCAYLVDGWWELWRFVDSAWQLTPARVTLLCLGPQFDNEEGDHLRIDFGSDADFLPQPEAPESPRRVQSNLRGMVRLLHEIEASLPVARRSLWSESGENFAARLEAALSEETA